jgi:hypothetical protein
MCFRWFNVQKLSNTNILTSTLTRPRPDDTNDRGEGQEGMGERSGRQSDVPHTTSGDLQLLLQLTVPELPENDHLQHPEWNQN